MSSGSRSKEGFQLRYQVGNPVGKEKVDKLTKPVLLWGWNAMGILATCIPCTCVHVPSVVLLEAERHRIDITYATNSTHCLPLKSTQWDKSSKTNHALRLNSLFLTARITVTTGQGHIETKEGW